MKILASPGIELRAFNPYTYLLYTHIQAEVTSFSLKAALSGSYDVFHLHWPDGAINKPNFLQAYAFLQTKLALIDYLKARGTKIVWTVHNLKSHELRHPSLQPWFWKAFLKQLDGFIALSDGGIKLARERFPALNHLPGFVVPHGHYRGEYPSYAKSEARSLLGIPASSKVILNFGQIRSYKNIDKLVIAFKQIPDPDLTLLIGGGGSGATPAQQDLADQLRKLSEGDPRILLHLQRLIPPEDVGKYMSAADIVVLPYREVLNSGTALLGLSFNRPIAVSGVGAMQELATIVGDHWVHLFHGELTKESLQESLEWLDKTPREQEAPLDSLDWTVVGKQYEQAFRQIIEGGGART